MYRLTLTADERRAIDWVGHRYSNGTDLYRLLFVESKVEPEDADWDAKGDLTFVVPEHVAWQIAENYRAEDECWPCFADPFAAKMNQFVAAIV
jgi:hypothetical protein